MSKKSNKVYIYNQRQANYYLSRGIMPIGFGQGVKGEPYLVFKYQDHKLLFGDWMKMKDTYMLNN